MDVLLRVPALGLGGEPGDGFYRCQGEAALVKMTQTAERFPVRPTDRLTI